MYDYDDVGATGGTFFEVKNKKETSTKKLGMNVVQCV